MPDVDLSHMYLMPAHHLKCAESLKEELPPPMEGLAVYVAGPATSTTTVGFSATGRAEVKMLYCHATSPMTYLLDMTTEKAVMGETETNVGSKHMGAS